MTDDFNINQEDYSLLLENIDNEIEIVVEDFIRLDLKELADLLSEDFELELIPSAIPTEKSTAEEEIKKAWKKQKNGNGNLPVRNFTINTLENPILKSMKRNVTLALKVYTHILWNLMSKLVL